MNFSDIQHLIEAGLHIFPCATDKSPLCRWKDQYSWSPTETFAAVGMATGSLSGNVEVIDVDNPNLFESLPKVNAVVARTVSGGYHLIYRCEAPEPNQKLAMSYQRVAGYGEYGFDWRPGKLYKAKEYGDGWYISTASVETRGVGGYILISPSPGYELLKGSLTDIPVLTTEQRDKLFFHCRSLGEHPPTPKVISRKPSAGATGTRPGDAFNCQVTLDDLTCLLTKHGWTVTGDQGQNRHFARPGKVTGTSATLGGSADCPLFYVFTSSTEFEAEKAYTPFQVLAKLEHGDDYSAAALSLAKFGYGEAERDPTIELITHEEACAMPGIGTPLNDIPAGSLIDLGMAGLVSAGAVNIQQLLYPIVISHIARASNGYICCEHVHPSFSFIKVAGTSVGKSKSNQIMQAVVRPAFEETVIKTIGKRECEVNVNIFYGPDEVASGQAMLKALADRPKALFVFDEITGLFSGTGGKQDPMSADKKKVLLQLSTHGGSVYEKKYADDQKDVVIDGLLFNMLGNATPVIFDHFNNEDIDTGTIQRLDFSVYDGKIPRRSTTQLSNATLEVFSERLKAIMDVSPACIGNLLGASDVGLDDAAKKFMNDLSDKITDEQNSIFDDGEIGLIGRAYNTTLKYGIIHAVATKDVSEMFISPLNIDDVKYGYGVASAFLSWQRKVLLKKIPAGEFAANCDAFMEAVISAQKMKGQLPTGKLVASRKRRIKNLKPNEWDLVVKVLKARGELVTEEVKNKTIYRAVRGVE